jgi:hypothetical protein
MSKELEALENIRNDVIDFRDVIEGSSYSDDEDYNILKKALEELEELRKRETPMKVIIDSDRAIFITKSIDDIKKSLYELERLRELEEQISKYFETENSTDPEVTLENIVTRRMILQMLKRGEAKNGL